MDAADLGGRGVTAPWRLFAAFGVAATVMFFVAPSDGLLQAALFPLVNGAAVTALLVGVRRHRPQPAAAWWLFVASSVVYWFAVLGWALYSVLSGRPLPFPSVIDLLAWAAYIGWFSFLVVVLRVHTRGAGAVIDALVIAGGVAVVGWEMLIAPALNPSLPTATFVASVTYPVLLTALAAVTVRSAIAHVDAPAVHLLLVTWIGLELLGDVWYGLVSGNNTFQLSSRWSALFLLSYTSLGALALHPRLATLTRTPVTDGDLTRRRQIAILTLAGLLPAVTLVLRGIRDHTLSDVTAILVISMAIFVAIMIRLERSTADLATERRLRDQLERSSIHDPLTGLVNRVGFGEAVRRALAARRAHDRAAMVLLADLDGFKAVNDAYGHDAGDQLLREVARRLSEGVRDGDTVGRIGGDEFAVVIDDIDPVEGLALADRLAAAVAAPVDLGPANPSIGVSLGVYRSRPGDDADQALRHADAAMYAAKNVGGGVQLFDARRHRGFLDRYLLTRQLRAAPAAGELVVHYQPIYRLADRGVHAAEALVRWQHPEQGWLLPGDFIELAEHSGAILGIDRWVLQQACRDAAAWQHGAAGTCVTVNLSRRYLQGSEVVAEVAEALQLTGLQPHLLILEITETAVADDIDEVVRVMHQLAALDVQLAMDDFGAGYSSLADLRRMPIDVLKMDRGFVSGIARTEEEWMLAGAIVRLASSLGKHTLAEGIEEAAQLAHLRSLGCEFGQGYLFARPMPVDDLLEVLRWSPVTAR